ncbi:hypothetical protein K3V95_14715, partial [Listeria monocytogenes]|nr:hypothetical protein [Listeria monocytogenes]
ERRTVLIGVVVLAASLSEGSANTWLSLAVVDGFRRPESMGGVVLGLFVGLAGGSFAVGIAYTSAWFEKERQGTAMGIFGAGNAGAAITNLVAPMIVVA